MESDSDGLNGGYQGSSYDSSLESPATSTATVAGPDLAPRRRRFFSLKSNLSIFVINGLLLALIIIIGVVAFLLGGSSKQPQASGSKPSNYSVSALSVKGISASQPLQIGTTDQLKVNGQLAVGNTLILLPTATPVKPITGQIYYDGLTNQPYYFNGSNFISLAPTVVPQHVTSIGGVAGPISVGNGLQVANGQLSTTSTSQVLVGGNGIAINGATVNNQGVVSLAAGTANVVISQDGNGNYTLSDNSVTGSGSVGEIALFTGGQTLGGSILSQSGNSLLDSGNLTVSGAISTNTLQQTSAGNNLNVSAGNDSLIFTAGGRTFEFPTSGPGSQVICTTGISCASGGGQAVLLQPGSAQLDTGSSSSIFVNNNGGGNLLELQGAGSDRFIVTNAGNTTIVGTLAVQGASTTVGTASQRGSLILNDGNGGSNKTATLQGVATLGQNTTYTLPDPGQATATICVSTNNCTAVGGAGGDLAGSYPNPTIAELQGSTLTIASPATGQVLEYNGSAFVNGLITNSNLQTGTFANITGVGILTTGSIGSGFGTISTGNNITTSAALQGGTATFTGANALTLGTASTSTGSIVFQGSGGADTLTLQGPITPAAGNFTLSIPAITGNANICTDNSVCAGYAAAPVSGAYIQQVPATTAANTITPATSGVVGLTVNGTNTGTAATAINVLQGGAAAGLAIASNGSGDGQDINLANTSGTQTNGLSINRNGAGGTTTNLLNLTNTAGTVTNGILLSGVYTNLINAGSAFTVDNAGDITAGGTYNTNTFNSNTLTFGATGAATVQSASGQALNVTGSSNLLLDTGGAGTVNIGNTHATTIQIGNTGSAIAQTINLGNNTTAGSSTALTAGSLIGASPTVLQGGTGGVGITAAAGAGGTTGGNGGAVSLTGGNGGNGSTANGNGGNLVLSAGAAGSGAGTAGTAGSVIIQNQSNSTTAFQVQNTAGADLLQVDTLNSNITIGGNNSATLAGWNTTTAVPASGSATEGSQITANGYVYVLGGDGNLASTTVRYARLNTNGTIPASGTGSWGTTTAMPVALRFEQVVSINGYIYTLGGGLSSGRTSAVYYAKENLDGTLGSWIQTTSFPLPNGLSSGSAAVYNGYVYEFGGYTNTSPVTTNNIYYAKANGDGTLGAWQTNANIIPGGTGIEGSSTTIANGYVYLIGGFTGTSYSGSVYYAKMNNDGSIGSWTLNGTSPLTIPGEGNASTVLNGFLYVFGGDNTGGRVAAIGYAPLNGDGSVGTWAAGPSLPTAESPNNVINMNGYLYIIGGEAASGITAVYYTTTPRLEIGGSVDLVGLGGKNLAEGGSGGTLTAGNTTIVGTLQVQGQSTLSGGLSVGGTLAVAGPAILASPTNSTAAFQVQNASNAVALNVDTTNLITTIQAGTDTATLGSNLATCTDFTNVNSPCTSGMWTTTGWTAATTTATHNTGNTTSLLTNQVTPTINATYEVTYTVSGTPATSTLSVTFGGQTVASYSYTGSSSGNVTETKLITATSNTVPASYLTFTPSTAFNGIISAVSIQLLTPNANAALVVKNASGVANLEVRASSSTTNDFIGLSAGQSNSSGTQNVALGTQALQSNTTGVGNSAVGYQALQSNVNGTQNVALGTQALQTNTNGFANAALGYQALQSNTDGNSDTAVGTQALQNNVLGINNTAIGSQALKVNTASSNTAVGVSALTADTTGSQNTAVGLNALRTLTTATSNTAVGFTAGNAVTTGTGNSFLGVSANPGQSLYQIAGSTAIGIESAVNQSSAVILGCTGGINGCGTTSTTGIGSQYAPNPLTVNPGVYGTNGNGTSNGSSTTIAESGTTGVITGAGTTFTSSMVGGTIYYADGTTGTIKTFTGTTSLTATTPKTVSSGTTYTIVYGGFNVQPAGTTYLQPTTDSTSAFQVQNSSNTTTLLDVDSTNTRVGIGTATPAYSLDVVGDINASSTLKVGGVTVCTSAGCTGATTSGSFINNGTVVQSADFYVQTTATGQVAGTIQALNGQTADIFDIISGAATPIKEVTITNTGAPIFKTSAASTSAFQVQSAASATILDVDNSNNRVGVGTSAPSQTLTVVGSQNFRLASPSGVSATPSASGGTLAAATYFYKVTALDGAGNETNIGSSTEVSAVVTGSGTGSVLVSWSAVQGAVGGYRVYRGTSTGAENTFFSVAQGTNSLTDTGTAGTAGTGVTTNNASAVFISAGSAGANSYFDNGNVGIGTPTPGQTLSVAGTALFQSALNNSTTAFQIQNVAGTSNLFVADTTNNKIGIGAAPTSNGQILQVTGGASLTSSLLVGTNLQINTASTSAGGLVKIAVAGTGGVNINDVVILNSSNQVVDTTTARDPRVYGVSITTSSVGTGASLVIGGNATVNATAVSTPINIGDQLVTSTTTGDVMSDNSATTGIVGIALSALASGTGTVSIELGIVHGQSNPDFTPLTDSTTAFQVQNAGRTTTPFDVDTTNTRVGIGTSAPGNLLSVGALTTASSTSQIAVSTGGTTNSGIVIQTVASQSSGYFLQAQNSTGANLASIDYQGNLIVQNATVNGTLTVDGHIVTANSSGSTTAAVNANAGSGGSPACTVTGNDTGGQVTLTTGTSGWASGTQCTVTFANAFGSAPHPVISNATSVSPAAVGVYVNSNTTTFTLNFINADTAQHTYTWNYFNAQ